MQIAPRYPVLLFLSTMLIVSCSNTKKTDAVDGTKLGRIQSAVTNCGLKPPADPCFGWTCVNLGDGTWEWEPTDIHQGAPCAGGGTCDEGGNCVRPPVTAPTGLTVFQDQSTLPNKIVEQFICSRNELFLTIYRMDNGGAFHAVGPNIPAANCPAGAFSIPFFDSLVSAGNQYCYLVQAVGTVATVNSATVCTTLQNDPNPPAIPTNGVMTAGAQSLTVSWSDNAINEDGYRLYIRMILETNPGFANAGPIGGLGGVLLQTFVNTDRASHVTGSNFNPPLTYTATGLTPGQLYRFEIQAYHSMPICPPGQTCPDLVSSDLIVGPMRPWKPVPAALPNFRILRKTTSTVTLGWDAIDFVESYILEQSINNFSTVSDTYSCDSTECVANRITPNVNYCFKAYAMNHKSSGGVEQRGPLTAVKCTNSYQFPQPLRAVSVSLPPRTTTTGRVLNVANNAAVVAGGELDFLELAANNDSHLAGMILVPPNTTDNATCSLATTGAVYISREGGTSNANYEVLRALYSQIGMSNGITLRGCPIYTATPSPAPSVTMVVHYSPP